MDKLKLKKLAYLATYREGAMEVGNLVIKLLLGAKCIIFLMQIFKMRSHMKRLSEEKEGMDFSRDFSTVLFEEDVTESSSSGLETHVSRV